MKYVNDQIICCRTLESSDLYFNNAAIMCFYLVFFDKKYKEIVF